MNINIMMIKSGLAALILTALTACGGGVGGSSSGGDDNPDPTPDPVSQIFTVSLSGVEIQRLSNGEEVAVDTSGVESGDLEYTP